MLLLDVSLDDAQRAKILDDARALVQAHGTIVSDNEYGRRSMAYEIDHAPDVDYALLQFQGPAALLEQLSRTLRITDGVVRFRVIKLRNDSPPAPDLRQSAVPAPEAAEAVAEPAAG
jgi:small subunit ribosomal protein S6